MNILMMIGRWLENVQNKKGVSLSAELYLETLMKR